MKIVGVSGDIGSFSEQAGNDYCRKSLAGDYKLRYLISVENVLNALKNKEIDLGIFPIENSNGGIVIESVYAMSRYIFKIKELFEIPVIHCLLVMPGIEEKDIKNIASHDQALKQCKMYLRRKWPEAHLQATADTATTAKRLSKKELSDSTAVLAPEGCAELYKLKILEK